MTPDDPHLPTPPGELLRRWQTSGDVDALDALLRDEVGMLRDRIRASGGNMLAASASATDVAQEAVLRLLKVQTPPQFDDPRALRGYLWTCAWHLLLERADSPRRRLRRVDLSESQSLAGIIGVSGGQSAVDDADQCTHLTLAMNLLRDDERDLIERIYFRGESAADVAVALGVSRDAVNMRLSRARRQLARRVVSWAKVVA